MAAVSGKRRLDELCEDPNDGDYQEGGGSYPSPPPQKKGRATAGAPPKQVQIVIKQPKAAPASKGTFCPGRGRHDEVPDEGT